MDKMREFIDEVYNAALEAAALRLAVLGATTADFLGNSGFDADEMEGLVRASINHLVSLQKLAADAEKLLGAAASASAGD
jgi:hypothetical protein